MKAGGGSSGNDLFNVGVGLVLERLQEGSIFVRALLPGSPALTSRQIRVNDKLIRFAVCVTLCVCV